VFEASIKAIAAQLTAAARDYEVLEENAGVSGLARKAARWIASLASEGVKPDPATERGMDALARRLDQRLRENTDQLIALHGLAGRAREEIPTRMASAFDVTTRADAGTTGVLGGMVTGALGGLAADLSAGGLTFGAGALIGGIVGALGGAGAAKAYNLAAGVEEGVVRWSPTFLFDRPAAALLRYLAVAHYGRGRGDWVEGEYPAHWRDVVQSVLQPYREELAEIWKLAEDDTRATDVNARLESALRSAARETLERLYPRAAEIFERQ